MNDTLRRTILGLLLLGFLPWALGMSCCCAGMCCHPTALASGCADDTATPESQPAGSACCCPQRPQTNDSREGARDASGGSGFRDCHCRDGRLGVVELKAEIVASGDVPFSLEWRPELEACASDNSTPTDLPYTLSIGRPPPPRGPPADALST